jgi:hypothetical protein
VQAKLNGPSILASHTNIQVVIQLTCYTPPPHPPPHHASTRWGRNLHGIGVFTCIVSFPVLRLANQPFKAFTSPFVVVSDQFICVNVAEAFVDDESEKFTEV